SCFVSHWPYAQCYKRGRPIQTGTLISCSIRAGARLGSPLRPVSPPSRPWTPELVSQVGRQVHCCAPKSGGGRDPERSWGAIIASAVLFVGIETVQDALLRGDAVLLQDDRRATTR